MSAKKKSAEKKATNVFIRTVTNYYTGRVVKETAQEIVLSEAAWIADTGRFHVAMANGTFSEVEPYPDGMQVRIQRNAIVDVTEWPHALPRTAT